MTDPDAARYPGLRRAARELIGIDLSSEHLGAFRWYRQELQSWNQRFNLTAITEPVEVEVKHFLDSLTCLLAMDSEPRGRLIDVGTGAGFPGIPLRIVCPDLEVTLVESTGKKADFCRHVIERLGLSGMEVRNDRVEKVAHESGYREAYRWGVARALAPLDVLGEYVLPLIELGGRLIAMKGETGPAEVQEAEEALGVLGGQVERLVPVELPTVVETRYLVLVKKVSRTPDRYPRRVGVPEKRPLRDDIGAD